MVLSLFYRLVRCLFGLLSVLVRSDLSKDVELLVLRYERRKPRGRLRWDHADRLWLAALSRLVSRRRWAEVFPVAPYSFRGPLCRRTAMQLSAPNVVSPNVVYSGSGHLAVSSQIPAGSW